MAEPPRLNLRIHAEGDEATIICSGKLVAGVTDTLSREVRELIPRSKHIVLDLTELTYMDSMGLGAIARLVVSAKTGGCRLELINLSARVRELFKITNLFSAFEVCGERDIRMP